MMTDNEIRESYNRARNRKTQVQVLADLNACSRVEMEAKLVELGLIHETPQPSFDFLRAAELYAEGKPDLDIAEQIGCSKATIAKWRKSKNLAANYPKQRASQKPQKRDAPKPQRATAPGALSLATLLPILQETTQLCGDVRLTGDSSACRFACVEIFYGADGKPLRAQVRLLAEDPEEAHA